MITKFYIDNFKSLVDFQVTCHPLTCLIGVNNSGKSTVLRAIDFLSSIAGGRIRQWLESKEWKSKDLKSQFKKRQTISFELHLHLDEHDYSWEGALNLGTLSCGCETVTRNDVEEVRLLEVKQGAFILSGEPKRSVDFDYEGSILASLKEQLLPPELINIKRSLQSIKLLETLNPSLMRKPSKTANGELGPGGENLSSFLYGLPEEKKKNIFTRMQPLFDRFGQYFIKAKRSGWKELWIRENFNNGLSESLTEAKHASDGFLRVLALFSQLQTDHAVLLFDEIEDGINHEIMEFIMDELVNSDQQVFFTTHSPMILNFLEDEVAKKSVMFVYRDLETGITKARGFFDMPQIKEMLEYMGPGEVFANVNLKETP